MRVSFRGELSPCQIWFEWVEKRFGGQLPLTATAFQRHTQPINPQARLSKRHWHEAQPVTSNTRNSRYYGARSTACTRAVHFKLILLQITNRNKYQKYREKVEQQGWSRSFVEYDKHRQTFSRW